MKKLISIMTGTVFLTVLQLLASLLAMFAVIKLDMVPMKYVYVLAAILVVLWLLCFLLIYVSTKRKYRKRKVASKLFSILISLCLIIASCMAFRGTDFISNITGGDDEVTYSVSLYVLEDSGYDSLDDLKDKKIGIDYEKESPRLVEAVNAANKELGTTIDENLVEYDSYATLCDALYNKDIDGILCCEELAVLMESEHQNFDTKCEVIWTYSITEENDYTTDSVDSITEEPFAVYITGIDTYGKVNTVSRSDVNLILVANPTTRQILLVSIPRDMQITLHMNGQMDKLTHTGIYGTDETISTIEDFLDMDINYYMRTNFTGLINIVNTLGGVTVDSPYDFDCTIKVNHEVFHVNKGINKLNGKQALSFVRERHHLPSGDLDRGRNQQILLQAMIEKCMTPTIIVKYNQLLKDVEDCFETDLTADEIKALANMQLNDMSSWNFKSVQVAGSYDYRATDTYSMPGQESYVTVPDQDKKQQIEDLIDKVENGEILTKKDVEDLK